MVPDKTHFYYLTFRRPSDAVQVDSYTVVTIETIRIEFGVNGEKLQLHKCVEFLPHSRAPGSGNFPCMDLYESTDCSNRFLYHPT